MPSKFRPLNNRVLVKPDAPAAATAAGVVIPETSRKTEQRGTVVVVGPGKYLANGTLVVPYVKPDDHVLYAQHGGIPLEVDGEPHLLMDADNIYAIL